MRDFLEIRVEQVSRHSRDRLIKARLFPQTVIDRKFSNDSCHWGANPGRSGLSHRAGSNVQLLVLTEQLRLDTWPLARPERYVAVRLPK